MIALLLTGCLVPPEPEVPTDTSDTDTDVPTPRPPRPAVRCTPSIDGELGTPDGHAVDQFSFTWLDQSNSAVSPGISFRLPEDLVGLSLLGLSDAGVISIGSVQLDDTLITDQLNRTPFFSQQVNGSLPTNAATDLTVDVPTGGHCLTLQLVGDASLAGQEGGLAVITRRGQGQVSLDLNLVFVGGTEARLNQGERDEMVQRIEDTWNRSGGPVVGTVQTFTLDGSSLITRAQASDLTAANVEPDIVTGIDIFFLADVTDGEAGLLGFAGGVPGVLGIDGLPGSGVVILMDSHQSFSGQLSGDFLGATIAHEVGHQVGLNHSTERDGTSLAFYSDVPVCDLSFDTNGDGLVDSFECANAGADNFMFWTGAGELTDISPEQALVLAHSVATR